MGTRVSARVRARASARVRARASARVLARACVCVCVLTFCRLYRREASKQVDLLPCCVFLPGCHPRWRRIDSTPGSDPSIPTGHNLNIEKTWMC